MSREFEIWFMVYVWFAFGLPLTILAVSALIKGKPSKPKKYINKYIGVYIKKHTRI